MGCWNGTCGLTQVAIMSGEKVDLFITVDTPKDGGTIAASCGTADISTPLGFSIKGTYDDYGSIENVKEDNYTKTLLSYFKELHSKDKLVLSPKSTDNPFESIEDLLQAIERGHIKLKVKSLHETTLQQVGLTMFNSTIVDNILTSEDLPFKLPCKYELAGKLSLHKASVKMLSYSGLINELAIYDTTWCSPYNTELLLACTKELEVTTMAEYSARLRSIDALLLNLRRQWLPQAGGGSQDDGYEVMLLVNEKVREFYKEREDMYDD